MLIFYASSKEFQIFWGTKKQKEFVPCRTLFMRGIFRIFSEFLKLRVRQRFSISSRRYVGDKSLRILKVWICHVHLSPNFQRWQASFIQEGLIWGGMVGINTLQSTLLNIFHTSSIWSSTVIPDGWTALKVVEDERSEKSKFSLAVKIKKTISERSAVCQLSYKFLLCVSKNSNFHQ